MNHRPPSFQPLLAAGTAAVLSVGLLAWAVTTGALGPDVGRGANFCEAARSGPVLQPANTWSNLGFVVAGLAVGWQARWPRARGTGLIRATGLVSGYAVVVVLLGPASAAMHATQSAWGGHLDLLSMYLVASFAAAYALARHRGGGTPLVALLFALLLGGCELVGALPVDVPLVHVPGNLAFGVLLVVALSLELRMVRSARIAADGRYAVAAGATMALAFAVWIATNAGLCDPHSLLQGHAVWHLLGAVSAYLLFRYYASERPTGLPRESLPQGAARAHG
ncbi:ceramidase domain-containing protein [Nocardioides sp.]|uniref:ceramidase domain-containing protein n=1 Tax=Nocardioides sp. TaxID=35761 RepID=UPI0035277340